MYIRHAQVRPSLSSVFPSQWDAKSVIRMGSSPGLSSALACWKMAKSWRSPPMAEKSLIRIGSSPGFPETQ